MPDRKGLLSPAEQRSVDAWMGLYLKDYDCPVSKDQNWLPGTNVVVSVNYSYGLASFEGHAYPMIPVLCGTCGYTLMFSAVVLGIFPESDRDAK